MLRIQLFGRLRLLAGDQPLKIAALPKTLPLLGYLLLHRAQPVPRDQVAFLFWPGDSEANARASLRRHLHDLKRLLPQGEWIASDKSEVQWNPASLYWLAIKAAPCRNTSASGSCCATSWMWSRVELIMGQADPFQIRRSIC